MKYIFIVLLLIGLHSCTKCFECEIISEENFNSADAKCNGYANSYPNDYSEISSYSTEICGKSLYQVVQENSDIISTVEVCPGIVATSRIRANCK